MSDRWVSGVKWRLGLSVLALSLVTIPRLIGQERSGAPAKGGGDETGNFYHDLLGLQCRSGDPRARLGWYDTRPFLEDMYGVVGGQLRNVTFLVPGSPFFVAGEEMQIEPIEFNRATGKPLNLRPQDSGASRMIFRVTGHQQTRRLHQTGWGEGGDDGRRPGRG